MKTSHRLPRQHLHLLMNVVVISHLQGEIFNWHQFNAEDKMPEEVVRKLRHFRRVLNLPCDGIRIEERIVPPIVIHVPAI